MQDWGHSRLRTLLETQKGYAFKSGWYCEAGRPIVKVSNFTHDSIDTANLVCIPESIAADYLKYELRLGDVVVQTVGSWPSNPASVVGKCVRIPGSAAGALLNQNAVRLSPKTGIDRQFLFYLLRNDDFKSYIVGTAQGAASQAAITLDSIRDYEFDLPPIPQQRRIAGILSAYDELIENCQRRIQILEGMARALYREWFVDFRFPGHEKVRFVESELGEIPEGWEARRLDDVCDAVEDGDWIETKDQGGNDYRLVQISNIGVGEFIETGNLRFITEETFDRLRCTEIEEDDILVARMPTPVGRAWLVTSMPWRMVTAVDVAIVRVRRSDIHPLFLIHAWNQPFNLQRIAAQASGTTRLRITRRQLAALEFLVPPPEIQYQFAELVGPHASLTKTLRLQIDNLRSTRDLLLPRLMSGQIEVTAD